MCDTHTHTHRLPRCSLLVVCKHFLFSHLPFWSSWVCHPFYKQALMTSQQGSSLSEDREWFLVYIACLQCNDSSKASSGLWGTLVVGFFTCIYSREGHWALFQRHPNSYSHTRTCLWNNALLLLKMWSSAAVQKLYFTAVICKMYPDFLGSSKNIELRATSKANCCSP